MKTTSLKRRLVAFCLFLTLLVAVAISLIEINSNVSSYRTLVQEHLDRYGHEELHHLAQALWLLDKQAVEREAHHARSTAFINRVVIKDLDGKILSESGSAPTGEFLVRSFPVTYIHNGQDVRIGEIDLIAGTKTLRTELEALWWKVFFINAAIVLSVFVLLYILFDRFVLKRLLALETHFRNINVSPEGALPTYADQYKGPPDEVSSLKRSFNAMVERVNNELASRKTAEKNLEEKEEVYRTLVESAATIPWEFDLASGRFTYIGTQIESVLGLPQGTWSTLEEWAASIVEEDRKDIVEFCASEKRRAANHVIEYRMRHADGSIRWIRDNVSVRFAGTDPVTLSGFMFDITKEKNAEEERLRLLQQLNHAQRIEAIGTLAGGIAHDFNNILSAIIGYSELTIDNLEKGCAEREYIQEVLTASARARELVKQILTFSRKSHMSMEPIQSSGVVEEALRLLRQTIPTTVRIEQSIDKDAGMVYADATQLHQVVMNLCTNAHHALPDEGGTIKVSLSHVALYKTKATKSSQLAPGNYVQLVVEDNGQGMAPETLARIFEPFYTTKEAGKGTGMGMSVVHGIVVGCGGAIDVQSALGKGTRITIYLPQCVGEEKTQEDEKNSLPGGKGRILVVDDEPSVARVTAEILRRLGYHVDWEQSSVTALRTIENNPAAYDAVVTDQNMPDLSGISLTEKLLGIRPGLPIILCTGYSDKLNAERARELGAKALLYKPIEKNLLASVLRDALGPQA